jgi:hypothetical protein
MANGKTKGNSFEREICGLLSKWWSNNDSDCIFWRTASSGGRATQRTKKGSKTKNHYGDITATDPIGQPLLDIVTLELKRGYSSSTIADLLDKADKSTSQQYENWIEGIAKNAINAGSFSWMLIVKRNRKKALLFTSKHLMQSLESIAGTGLLPTPYLSLTIKIGKEVRHVVGMTLEGFLKTVKPSLIRLLAELQRKRS